MLPPPEGLGDFLANQRPAFLDIQTFDTCHQTNGLIGCILLGHAPDARKMAPAARRCMTSPRSNGSRRSWPPCHFSSVPRQDL